jgi:hypothetical protein
MTAQTPKTFREYIQRIHDSVGTDKDIGVFLGFPDGSRVGTWRKGQGRPDELNCIKLARWTGDDPLMVLRLAGYVEMADLLQGLVGPPPIPFTIMKPHLDALAATANMMVQLIEEQEARSAVAQESKTKKRG